MSHLTEFSLVLAYVKRRLGGEKPVGESYRYHGEFGGVTVDFPLLGIPSLEQVAGFYTRLNVEVERSRLRPERKRTYQRFTSAAYHAHRAATENQPRKGSIWHLRDCLTYITKALRIMENSKEYEDKHPVHWSEVYRPGCSQCTTTPEEYWLLFKLESLLPVLRLSVRILRLVFPDCHTTWTEWEYSLCRKEWLQQFKLDSRMSSWKRIPLHAPRRADVVGLYTLETPQTQIRGCDSFLF
ncbi:hypothetical protein F4801DRAFT_474061 [Xylaria longipes]|nr:hypothetical protein F4801DRAFT_474061 [Xylaria longipes]RYC57880.1 hypothetical protein CHU98_g8334 [Xylaria longipes]